MQNKEIFYLVFIYKWQTREVERIRYVEEQYFDASMDLEAVLETRGY